MRLRSLAAAAAMSSAFAGLLALAGCNQFPGYPGRAPVPPDQVTDFHELFETNCQACHGVNGQHGPAMDLANPEFQAIVDDNTLRGIISNGLPGTQMPAWAQSAGGMLTSQQIDAIIAGMRREWRKPNVLNGAAFPPYAVNQPGNTQHGQQMYQARCSSCHQKFGREQVTSPVYLSLVSDQALRSIIIAGRPDIGQPDWRLRPVPVPGQPQGAEARLTTPGAPLSPQDVTDIVAYLGSLRNPSQVSAAPNPMEPRR